jgi:tetratricopeptide (TPR) repeat protein
MRRLLLWSLLVLATLVLLLALAVSMLDAVEPADPDPAQPIGLPDGSVERLDRWLERIAAAPVEPLVAVEATPDASGGPGDAGVAALYPGMSWGPVFKLGEHARQAGHPDQALALFQSIPDGDPDYALARRRMAYELLERGETSSAVFVVKQAVAADPLAANGWQDLVQVCGSAAGLLD